MLLLLALVASWTALATPPGHPSIQGDAEEALVGPEGSRVWKLQPVTGVGVPADLSVVLQKSGPDTMAIEVFAHDDQETWSGDLIIEPDARRLVISLTVELSPEPLAFQGAVARDGRTIDGRCRRGRAAAPCRLVREDATAGTSPLPIPDARVSEMRFYEGPWDGLPPEQRSYRSAFDASTARTINYEINLEFPELAESVSFDVEVIWYRATGDELTRMPRTVTADAGWTRMGFWQGWGDRAPGAWTPGHYTVRAFVEGVLIAEGELDVVGPGRQP